MGAPDAVLELVERFSRTRAQYLNPAYNETQVRREFLDSFFTALGWDVDNAAGYAQAYKDVVHEDAIKVGLDTRAPDYSCRIGGVREFFVEAKKPAVNLKDDPAPAYWPRRYAWSTKLPLSVLTDFQEFAFYDCRVRPADGDKPSEARTLDIFMHADEAAGRDGEQLAALTKGGQRALEPVLAEYLQIVDWQEGWPAGWRPRDGVVRQNPEVEHALRYGLWLRLAA